MAGHYESRPGFNENTIPIDQFGEIVGFANQTFGISSMPGEASRKDGGVIALYSGEKAWLEEIEPASGQVLGTRCALSGVALGALESESSCKLVLSDISIYRLLETEDKEQLIHLLAGVISAKYQFPSKDHPDFGYQLESLLAGVRQHVIAGRSLLDPAAQRLELVSMATVLSASSNASYRQKIEEEIRQRFVA